MKASQRERRSQGSQEQPSPPAHPDFIERGLSKKYSRGESKRLPYIQQAEDCAKLTIPSAFPPSNLGEGERLPSPAQSIGARGLNTLTSKLMDGLFPPGTSPFTLSMDDHTLKNMSENIPDEEGQTLSRGKMEEALNEIERTVQQDFEAKGMRAPIYEGIQQLLVAGNYLLVLPKSGALKGFRLNRFVLLRDAEGNLLEAITKETLSIESLSSQMREFALRASEERENDSGDSYSGDADQDSTPEAKEVDIYTIYQRQGKKIISYQTVFDFEIPGTRGSWPVKKAPVLAMRLYWFHGEDYGRSYAMQYYGDLKTADVLQNAIKQYAAACAKIIFMVNPGGVTKAKALAEAENLSFVSGRDDDINCLQINKHADFSVAQQTLKEVEMRLSQAFIMNQSVQRNAERVTAEEIRAVIRELESALGGVYTLLSHEFQLPLVRRHIDLLEQQNRIPKISDLKSQTGQDNVQIKIISGMDALGRGADFSKYQVWMKEIVAPLGSDGLNLINIPELIKRGGAALGIDMDSLVKTPEDLQAEEQKQQQLMQQQATLEAAKSAAGPAVKAISDHSLNSQQHQQQQEATPES
ncbi:MAG: hypothetical protein JKY49_00500 [Cohaesibacteraceae bacterium]|nr:hypothetical protein [Cohaesibacteraceae bacterium]MBL4876194.1 hypothetical protein [Cohaesibacteraceae bacterium]